MIPSISIIGEKYIDSAIVNYIRYGIEPGSFTTLVLCQRPDEAIVRAHTMIRGYTNNICILVKKKLPSFLIGEDNFKKWCEQGGLLGDPDIAHTEVLFKLEADTDLYEGMRVLGAFSNNKLI